MKRTILFSLCFLTAIFHSFCQDTLGIDKPHAERKSVYRVRPVIDGAIIVGGLVSNYFGVRVLKGKKGVDYATVSQLSPADVNAFDRGAAKQDPSYADQAMKLSDITLTASFVYPAALLLDKCVRKDALKVGVVFLTTMSVMANAYSWGVGHINKYRPYVYNTNESIERRTRNGSRNSFYGGHAAAAASVSFFAAKVYHDYHPGSKLTPYLFGAALIPPAVVGYFRYKAGMHFPSDLICGSIAGAIFGVAVPQLHKCKNRNISLFPMIGPGNGVAMTIDF